MWSNELETIDFTARRKQFLKKTSRGVAVFVSNSRKLRNSDIEYHYRQDSNFYYLTGYDEADCLCLLAPNHKNNFQIFVPPRNKSLELLNGKSLGPERAKALLKADAAFPSNPDYYFDAAFIDAITNAEVLYYRVGVHPEMDKRIFALLSQASHKIGGPGQPYWPIHDPGEILGEMRLSKTKAEIQRLTLAANITAEAHASAMRLAKPGMFEYEIEAVVEHVFRQQGARRVAFGTSIASGPNTCVYCYTANNRRMKEKDLLLVDAGAEFDYYSGDVTRTFPVSGKFTEPQKEIYSIVLKAQKEAINFARPGRTMAAIHDLVTEILVEEMRRLKILKGSLRQLLKEKTYHTYFPHQSGHWLGMDVHDVGKYSNGGGYRNYRKLEPGYVFTIEPGLYFPQTSPTPAKYKGIGVRIEDDILVTTSGCKVLTSAVPKEIDEVESLCSQI